MSPRSLACSIVIIFALLLLPHRTRATTVVSNTASATYIFTLRNGVDAAGLAAELHLTPTHVYHHALNGFAAPAEGATVEQLRRDPRVLTVERDGRVVL